MGIGTVPRGKVAGA